MVHSAPAELLEQLVSVASAFDDDRTLGMALARIGKWITDLGEAGPGGVGELTAEALKQLLVDTDAPDGRITHLRPVLRMSGTPPYWERPPVPLGFHSPAWPAR